MILQLDPAISVDTPLGKGFAILIIDYGMHQNTCWVVTLSSSGIVKHFDCNDIIMNANFTYGINVRCNHFISEGEKKDSAQENTSDDRTSIQDTETASQIPNNPA
jgi:hypothetical protein